MIPNPRTKIAVAIGVALALFTPSIANAAEHQCYRAAKADSWVKTRKPQGNWGPQHNTRNWSYDAVQGGDIYRHKNGKRTVGTRCQGPGYNHGTLKIDFEGTQDWCVKFQAGWSESVVSPSCSPGFSLSADKATCSRPAVAGYWNKVRKPQGNWGLHNTRNWSYAAVQGGDIYRHRNGRRTVGTRCQGPGYNHGTLKIDLEGTQDWCARWVNAIPAATVNAGCPSGYGLRETPITVSGSVSSTANSVDASKLGPIRIRPNTVRPDKTTRVMPKPRQ